MRKDSGGRFVTSVQRASVKDARASSRRRGTRPQYRRRLARTMHSTTEVLFKYARDPRKVTNSSFRPPSELRDIFAIFFRRSMKKKRKEKKTQRGPNASFACFGRRVRAFSLPKESVVKLEKVNLFRSRSRRSILFISLDDSYRPKVSGSRRAYRSALKQRRGHPLRVSHSFLLSSLLPYACTRRTSFPLLAFSHVDARFEGRKTEGLRSGCVFECSDGSSKNSRDVRRT